MFSKEESKKLRQEFWTSFGKSFPRKWVLYRTKIKDFSFKFHFDKKSAMVSVEIEHVDSEWRNHYFEKWVGLKSIVQEELPDVIFEQDIQLDNGKHIARVYVEKRNVSIHTKETWQDAMVFLKDTMIKVESLWFDFEDYFKD